MKSFKPLPVAAYIISDMVAASAAWWLFTWYRRNKLQEGHTGFLQMFTDTFFQTSIVLIPLIWVCFFLLTGFYSSSLYKRSRLNEFTATFIVCLVGCLLIFFSVILNDRAPYFTYFYSAFFVFFMLQTGLTIVGRSVVLAKVKSHILAGQYRLNTLLIGNAANAVKVYKEVQKGFPASGYYFNGFVNTGNGAKSICRQISFVIGACRPTGKCDCQT